MDFTGTVLIASPYMEDPNFRMTVTLIVSQQGDAITGLVLNRPTSATVADICREQFKRECPSEEPVYLGGPVSSPPMALLFKTVPMIDSDQAMFSVELSVDEEQITGALSDKNQLCRVFVGYSGWTESQLRGEIDQGAWYLLRAEEIDIFQEPKEMWISSLQRSTFASFQRVIHLKRLPNNPEDN
ncbi:MAG: YqgE/AlgH family protein [Thermoguttaceae bacterium]|nr:YqgE/AlgH family protein [Thermoguttaceae bacterium]